MLILTRVKTCGFVPQMSPHIDSKEYHVSYFIPRFVTEHAPFFAETCTDGSHPLVWTRYHDAYKDIFENRLSQILQQLDVEQHDFASFCDWLKVNADIFEDDTEGLYPFLSSITASLESCLQSR